MKILVCPHCKSDDIARDGAARWSPLDQKWELSCTYDDMTCQACGQEFSEADEVDPDEDILDAARAALAALDSLPAHLALATSDALRLAIRQAESLKCSST